MQDLPKLVESFAPLANGPLAKPDGMRGAILNRVRRLAIPCAVSVGAVFLTTYVSK